MSGDLSRRVDAAVTAGRLTTLFIDSRRDVAAINLDGASGGKAASADHLRNHRVAELSPWSELRIGASLSDRYPYTFVGIAIGSARACPSATGASAASRCQVASRASATSSCSAVACRGRPVGQAVGRVTHGLTVTTTSGGKHGQRNRFYEQTTAYHAVPPMGLRSSNGLARALRGKHTRGAMCSAAIGSKPTRGPVLPQCTLSSARC